MFSAAYASPASFGPNVTYGAGGEVRFDDNRPSRGDWVIHEVDGDVVVKKDYYPWLSEKFILGHRKDVSLVGEGDIYVTYRSWNARNVYFEPVLHSEFLTHSVHPGYPPGCRG
jgi:hypothetical protein